MPFILTLIIGAFFKVANKYTGDIDGEQMHTGQDPIERGEDGGLFRLPSAFKRENLDFDDSTLVHLGHLKTEWFVCRRIAYMG